MSRVLPHDEVGMIAPPPVIYAAPLVAGWLLQQVWPWSIGGVATRGVRTIVFVVGLVAGLALGISGITSFVRRRTPVIPLRPTTTIVRGGPYRFTRNPMYVGLAVASVGIAIELNTWWAFVLLPLAIDRGVIAREERYLRSRFGAEYDEYTRQVRRWV